MIAVASVNTHMGVQTNSPLSGNAALCTKGGRDVYERAAATHRVLLVHVRYLSPQSDPVPTVCCADATWCGVHVVASCCLRCVLLSLPALSVYQQNLTTTTSIATHWVLQSEQVPRTDSMLVPYIQLS